METRRNRRPLLIIVALAMLGARTAAQIPGAASAPSPSSPATPTDPLGRDTPRGTIARFMSAVHGDRLGEAASYMEMRPGQRDNAGTLARDLTALLDRYFTQPITAINDSAAGVPNDGLPLDREAISLAVDERMFDVELVRVTDPEVGRIWLISSGTLDQVPSMRRSLQSTWVERRLPRSLVTRSLFGISLALWLVWAASIVGPLVAVWLLSVSVMYLATSRPREREALLKTWAGTLRWPIMIALTVGIHLAVMPYLGFSLSFRLAYRNVSLVIGVIALAWLLWRVITIAFGIASLFAYRRGEASARSLMLLSERVTKVVIVLLTLFALLTIAGVDTTTALAGVGLGGVAVALGAQKTVENLLGGSSCSPTRCSQWATSAPFLGRSGWIEDITLRSVRLRTVEQSLLSIPPASCRRPISRTSRPVPRFSCRRLCDCDTVRPPASCSACSTMSGRWSRSIRTWRPLARGFAS
jgi:MscS family membrane protein